MRASNLKFGLLTCASSEPQGEDGDEQGDGSASAEQHEPIFGKTLHEAFGQSALFYLNDARIVHHLRQRVRSIEITVAKDMQSDVILAAALGNERPRPEIAVIHHELLFSFAARGDGEVLTARRDEFGSHDRI